MASRDSITVEKYHPGMEAEFISYVKKAFHEKYILSDPLFLAWQFTALYVARAEGKIVGQFGFRDIPYKVGDRSVVIRVLMNLFVLDEYHWAGVGPLLAQTVFNTSNPILVSGYTDAANRLYAHLRPRWKEAGNLRRFIKILNPAHPLLAKFSAPRTSEVNSEDNIKFSIERIVRADDSLDAFWKAARNRYVLTAERSSEYLNWRFLSHPRFVYSVLAGMDDKGMFGYVVSRSEESEGLRIRRIVDIVAYEGYENILLREVIKSARDEKAAVIDFMHSGFYYDSALASAGFFDVEETDFATFPILFSPISWTRKSINIAYDLGASLDDCYFTKADGDQDRPNPV